MRFAYLSEVPALAPALAAAQSAAFAALLPNWREADALADLRAHDGTRQIPTTLLALDDDGDWLGTVSLLANDHDRIRDYSPWLATLVVREHARGSGLGAKLVRRAVEEAAALRVETLYLYCVADLVPYYEPLGWHVVARADVFEVADEDGIYVMAIDTAALPFSPREKVPDRADEGATSQAIETPIAASPTSP